jgi:hypothetical protein
MSPAMLTLVAVVLAYDIAREIWEARSSMVEAEDMPLAGPRRGTLPSRMERSWTRLEKDIVGVWGSRSTRVSY